MPHSLAPADLLQDLVDANHILFNEGVLDAFGHVSVRHPERPGRFLLARSMAPALVTEADLVEYELDGTSLDPQGRKGYLERFIHGEIYRARPDVQAVVHSHSPAVVPYSVSRRTRLKPVCHMGGFLPPEVPVFEIRDHAGDGTDLLVSSNALGVALAGSLGASPCVLMRGHGCTVVAPSLKLAVYRAIYTELNARLQTQALQLGEVEYLTPAESAAAAEMNAGQVDRPWQLWKAAARAAQARARGHE